MRMSREMSIKDFWAGIGYSLSRGHSYETGKTPIPESVRRLVYLQYILDVPTDPDSEEGQKFAEGLKEKHPIRLDNARRLMEDALSELKQ